MASRHATPHPHPHPFMLPLVLAGVVLLVTGVGLTQGVLQIGALGQGPVWFWAFLVVVLVATVLVWWVANRTGRHAE